MDLESQAKDEARSTPDGVRAPSTAMISDSSIRDTRSKEIEEGKIETTIVLKSLAPLLTLTMVL
jgi:hypothetical protein